MARDEPRQGRNIVTAEEREEEQAAAAGDLAGRERGEAMTEQGEREETANRIPCPFTYASDKRCDGHVVKIEAYKADLEWEFGDDGRWRFSWGAPRSHFHLFCSERDNHAGILGADDGRMKFFSDELSEDLHAVIFGTKE
jgi:hypothetical protein